MTSPVAAARVMCTEKKCPWAESAERRRLPLDCAGIDECLVIAHAFPHRRAYHLCGVICWLGVGSVWRLLIALVRRSKLEKGAAAQ